MILLYWEGYGYNSCERYYADYGEPLSCFMGGNTDALQTHILEGICGSGKDDDCENKEGDSYSHMVRLSSAAQHINMSGSKQNLFLRLNVVRASLVRTALSCTLQGHATGSTATMEFWYYTTI